MEEVVHPLKHRARLHQPRSLAAKHAPGRRHHQRGGHPVPGDVADDEPDLAVGQRDEVVEVSADLRGGAVERRDLPARQVRQRLREELLLDELRDAELLLDALARSDLGLLLAHELRDTDGRRGLRGELLEEPAVIRGVVLVGEPAAEVEEADELALADERHDELHAVRAQRADSGRVELQVVDRDRARARVEVRQDRVVRCDVDRRRLEHPEARGRCLRRGRRDVALPEYPPERPRQRQHRCPFYPRSVRESLRPCRRIWRRFIEPP